MNATVEDLTGQLMSIMLKLIELNEEFHEFKSADMATIIQTSLKSSVSHPFLCKVYSAGTLINDLRSARLAAYHKNKLAETATPVTSMATVAAVATVATVGDPEPVKPTEEAEISTTTLNPYTQFVKDMRPTVARENPLMTPQEIVKEIARQWKARSVKPEAEEPKKPKKAKEAKADVVVIPAVAGTSNSPTAATEPSVHEKKPKKGKAAEPVAETTVQPPLSVPAPPPVPEKKSKKVAKASEDPTPPVVAPAAPTVVPEPEAPKKKGKKAKAEEPPAPIPIPVEPDTTDADDVSAPLCERRKKIPKHIKTLVWNTHMGISNLESKCFSCRTEKVDARNFQCGHVVAEAKGGDLKISNLRPICQPCNGSMGTRSMNEFTKEFFGWEV